MSTSSVHLAHLLPRAFTAFFARFSYLQPVQQEAIPLILAGKNVFVTAPTGSGKTEAVLAPLAERATDFRGSVYALYICPTRALINDLEVRIEGPLAQMGLQAAIQHGDRRTFDYRRVPSFVFTTPESLDVLLSSRDMGRTARMKYIRAVIIDEVHQLFGTPRGAHLQILLERLKRLTGRPLQRICLSATVSQPEKVSSWFQGSDAPFIHVTIPGTRQVDVQLDFPQAESQEAYLKGTSIARILSNILENHRKVLLFGNTRAECDWLFWRLNERLGVPTFLHYSSLDRQYREQTEQAFRRRHRALCIATSTLELGIDIGDIDAVVMYGAPGSIASFVQRLGRGNRRTDISKVYALCRQYHVNGRPADPAEDLIYFVALVAALVHGELESQATPLFYSVLVQQFMALAYRYGCVAEDTLSPFIEWYGLPDRKGSLLRQILVRLQDVGLLQHDLQSDLFYPTDRLERLVALRKIWSNIASQEQALVEEEKKPLAEIPQQYARTLHPGRVVILAGKPRLVTRIEGKVVHTIALSSEQPETPRYFSIAQPTPIELAAKMREVLTSLDLRILPIRYDDWCLSTLQGWRRKFQGHKGREAILAEESDGEVVYYTFLGSTANRLLAWAVQEQFGIKADADAWRLKAQTRLPPLHALRLPSSYLHDLVREHINECRRALDPPPHFVHLPRNLQVEEVVSWLDIETLGQSLASSCKLPVAWLVTPSSYSV